MLEVKKNINFVEVFCFKNALYSYDAYNSNMKKQV